jgi:hypothetical protein
MLKWLHSSIAPDIIKEQAKLGSERTASLGFVGSVRVLAWLQSVGLIDLTDDHQRADLSDAAIAGGHVHTLQWLRSKELFELDEDVMPWEDEHLFPSFVAARRGHYSVVKYLYELNPNFIFDCDIRKEAVKSGSLQLVAYLVEQNIESWHPKLAEPTADQYMPDCLAIAGNQVSSCLPLSHSSHSSPSQFLC